MSSTPVRRALLSVSDKTGLVPFARHLRDHGVELLSTGGTYRLLSEHGIEVVEVSSYTGFPEIMGGRVKTLHPRIHGGILGRRGIDDDVMQQHDIPPIDMVVVNLYPFEATIARPECTFEEAIENIDIGGPAMLRACAKNHAHTTIVVDPNDYAALQTTLDTQHGQIDSATRVTLAAKAYAHTAAYDAAIARYLTEVQSSSEATANDPFPAQWKPALNLKQTLRYGENPHQQAAFYVEPNAPQGSIATATMLQGKALSYNNIADTDAALDTVHAFEAPACVIVKHANPCGVAVVESTQGGILAAYDKAFATDSESAFGGIIAFNRPLDAATAEAIISRQFVEVIVAPSIDEDALSILAKKANVRVLSCGTPASSTAASPSWDMKRVNGGLLVQTRDEADTDDSIFKVVTERAPTADELRDLEFAWKVAQFVKSNAIVYARDQRTVGVGAGQMSRVNSARIAGIKAEHAGLDVEGAAMASDAFFPFRDGIDNAAKAGIKAVIQPGGSIRDEQVIAAANEAGIAMVFTGKRHFRH